MSNNSTETTTTVLCTRSDNYSCWSELVVQKNAEYADQMLPVIIMMTTFAVFGVFGNTVVIVMYSTRKQRTSANIFVMFLAVIDLFACLTVHPYVIYKLFNFYSQTWTGICKVFEFLVHVNLAVSGLALFLIAVDRYLAICRPVKYLKFDEHVMKGIVAIIAVAVLGSIPLLEFYGPNSESFDMTDGVFLGYRCHYQEKYIGSISMAAFSGFVLCLFLVEIIAMSVLYKDVAIVAYHRRRAIAPLTSSHVLAGLNQTTSIYSSKTTTSSVLSTRIDVSPCTSHIRLETFTSSTKNTVSKDISNTGNTNGDLLCVTSVAKAQKRAGDNPSDRYTLNENMPQSMKTTSLGYLTQKRLKAAKILFTVTFVFFLSWMPFFILRICNTATNDQCHPTSYAGEIMEEILNHIFYINNAINPILYTITNKTFRHEFRNLLRKRFRCC